jgi:short-subunit dehydrogenase
MPEEQRIPSRILVLGATSAIAMEVARLLAPSGARFFLVARNQQRLLAVREDLLTHGAHQVGISVTDLKNTDAHPDILPMALGELGTIDLALIAHGILGDHRKAGSDYSEAEDILRTNFLSVVSLVTWLANYFELTRQGTLAVISSVSGDRARASNYVYASSKAGLNVFLDGVRSRVYRHGVHVLTILPGFVLTPMTEHLPQSLFTVTPARVARRILDAILRHKDVVYIPAFWAAIMFIVRMIPRRVFRFLDL